MKKIRILLFFLLFCTTVDQVHAQHIPQLWSQTQKGGTAGSGALFHYNPSTNSQVLDFSWPNDTPGQGPEYTDLVDGGNGKFYGVTSLGGANGKGVIFEWDPASNVYSKKIDFNGTDGGNPFGSLTLLNGKLYGMTRFGGVNDKGVIFEWDPTTNIYSRKIDFTTIGGSEPYGALTLFDNKFYGMTSQDGTNAKGVIFEWNPVTNIYSKKIDFTGINGSNPYGSLLNSNGKFYGMTRLGGANDKGVIFEWDPSDNSYSKKIDLSTVGGSNPYGSLSLFNGKFYGVTEQGGASDLGVIFEWDLSTNTYTKRIDFIGTNGSTPFGSLTLLDGKFYGMTMSGQTPLYSGIIFEWDPTSNTYNRKFNFDYANGAFPQGSLVKAGSKLYGVTRNGGFNRWGVIFEWEPSTNSYVKKIDLDHTPSGGYPAGSLTYNKGKFYGMTNEGGANGEGVIFEWNPYSKTYTKRYDFIGINGNRPSGDLIFYNEKFYGMTYTGGGFDNAGVIFEWDPVTNTYSKKISFNRTDGAFPMGSLTLYNGKFYGMTYGGGVNNDGVIFEWDPTTNLYQKKIDFENVVKGRNPKGSLALVAGKFYGVTEQGGANGHGVIFEWNPLTNAYSKKIDFDNSNGRFPQGTLALFGDKLYGMTLYGGNTGYGIIFEWDPIANIFARKIDFDGINKGSYPSGSLFLSQGKFYGMTKNGGINGAGILENNGYGTLFEWDPATNAFNKKLDFNAANGANPEYSKFIEVLSNSAPAVSNISDTQKKCLTSSGFTNFTLIDSDSDVPVFAIASSNQVLLPIANLSVTNVGGNDYQIAYTLAADQVGTTLVTMMASDGYDGEASFSFELTANPKKPVININNSLPAQPVISSSSDTGNQWYLNENLIDGATEKTFSVKDIGIYKVKVTVDGCSTMSDGETFIVNSQTINFTSIPEKKIEDPSFALTATSTSGLAVQFTTTSDNIIISGTAVTMVKPGSVTIDANQTGNNLFSAAQKVTQTFCINPAKPTLSVNQTDPSQPVLTSSSETGNQWYLNENLLAGATDKTITVKDKGIYQVKVAIDGCIGPLSDGKIFLITEDSESGPLSLARIYPNPVNELLTIQLNGFHENEDVHVVVFDGIGKIVVRRVGKGLQELTIDVNSLTNGSYYVRMTQNNSSQHIKLIKQ